MHKSSMYVSTAHIYPDALSNAQWTIKLSLKGRFDLNILNKADD